MRTEYGTWDTIRYLLKRLVNYDKRLVFYFATYTLGNACYSVLTLCIVPILIELTTRKVTTTKLVLYICGMLALEFFFYLTSQYSYQVYWPRVIKVRLQFMKLLNEKVMSLPYAKLEEPKIQEELQKAKRSISNNTIGVEGILNELFEICTVIISIGSVSVILVRLNLGFLLLLFVFTLLNYRVSIVTNEKNHDEITKMATADRKLTYLSTQLRNVKTQKDIRLYQINRLLNRDYEKAVEEKTRHTKQIGKNDYQLHIVEISSELLRNGLAYAYLIWMAIEGKLSVGEFTFYFMVISNFSTWLSQIMTSFAKMKQQKLYVNDYRYFMESEELKEKAMDTIPNELTSIEIEFEHVSFHYPHSTQMILNDVNFVLRDHEKIALVGMNGAGKTTIVKLLCGLYEPTSGKIKLNQKDIKQYSKQEYYRLISAVFQEINLFAFPIRENITLQEASEMDIERMRDCANLSGIGSKIESLPNQYETSLSKMFDEEGIELSGGEQQKLSVCRALYKNAPIMVLDEPTAALDPIAENQVYQDFVKLTKERAALFISHRLASTRFCNRILFLKDGVICEQGTHEELLKLGGEYARIYEIQSMYYREGDTDEAFCQA